LRPLENNNFATAALAACILGLLVSAYLYIAIGALFGFNLAFSVLILPLFLGTSGFLLWRYLSKPKDRPLKFQLIAIEIVSWIGVLAFLYIISGFTIMTISERIGLTSTFFLLASIFCLPLIRLRKSTTLEQRLMRLSSGITIGVLIVVLTLSSLAMMIYLFSTPRFIL